MCNYTQTLHILCGCKTLDLLLPNLCRVAIKNSMPCVYIAPHPDSIPPMPSLSFSASSISSMTISPQTPPSPGMSFNSFSNSAGSPQHGSFTASFEKQRREDDGCRSSMNLCPFHMEERHEVLEELFGRKEPGGVAKRTGAKARLQRRLRQQEKQRLQDEREEQKRLARERAESERLAKESAERKRKWMPSPKRVGMWTEQMVRDTLADGAGELREWNGYLYLVTDDGPQFLGSLQTGTRRFLMH